MVQLHVQGGDPALDWELGQVLESSRLGHLGKKSRSIVNLVVTVSIDSENNMIYLPWQLKSIENKIFFGSLKVWRLKGPFHN